MAGKIGAAATVAWGAALAALAACAAPRGGGQPAPDVLVREIQVRVLRPAPVNLIDRGIETLGVLPFEGPGGDDLARGLAQLFEGAAGLRVLGPDASGERVTKAGVSIGWEVPASSLRRVREGGGLDGLLVGRVETFQVEPREKTELTETLRGTGQFDFVLNEDGKLARRERRELAQVPLFCRTDVGTVGAAYRVWDARGEEAAALRRREVTMEMPSFCYRGDVSERVVMEARGRLLRKLFRSLNEQVVRELMPRSETARLSFEVLPGGADAGLVHRNELGLLYASRGEWGRAREMWQECLKEAPGLTAALYNLGRADQANGRLAAAAEKFRQALTLRPTAVYRQALREVAAAAP